MKRVRKEKFHREVILLSSESKISLILFMIQLELIESLHFQDFLPKPVVIRDEFSGR